MKKKNLLAVIAASMIVGASIGAVASSNYHLIVNGKEINADIKMINNRTYVPLRAVAEALKAKVDWTNATGTVTITTKDYLDYNSSNNNTTTVTKVNDATDVVNALKQEGLPISDVEVYTSDHDPNNLLGRPGQYTSKVNFKDTTVNEPGNSIEVVNGGSVEMFDNDADAQRRYNYISNIAKSVPMFNEYDYLNGKILLRVSRDLTPDQSKKYENALNNVQQ